MICLHRKWYKIHKACTLINTYSLLNVYNKGCTALQTLKRRLLLACRNRHSHLIFPFTFDININNRF